MIRASTTAKSGLYWMAYILPGLLFYTLFMAFPLLNSVRLSFFTGQGYELDTFIGFDNYTRLFTDPVFSKRYFGAFLHTWQFFFIHMVVQNTLWLLFAVLLMTKGLRGRDLYRTVIFIPATLAVLVTGYLWKLILNPQWGAVALLVKVLGVDGWAPTWLGDTGTALTAVSLVSSWQWVGMPTMMFLAGLQTIPEELYEAANIDGARGWQVFRHIKLPLLMPVVGIVSVLTFVNNFNAFDVVFSMENVNGAPSYSTDILGTFFYRVGIAGEHPVGIPDRGMGATVATLTFIVLAAGVAVIQRLTRPRVAR